MHTQSAQRLSNLTNNDLGNIREDLDDIADDFKDVKIDEDRLAMIASNVRSDIDQIFFSMDGNNAPYIIKILDAIISNGFCYGLFRTETKFYIERYSTS